jgi:hypothetical protein
MTDEECPHMPDGHVSMICSTCGGHVPECQIETHVCDKHREYVCSLHVEARKKHIKVLEKQ